MCKQRALPSGIVRDVIKVAPVTDGQSLKRVLDEASGRLIADNTHLPEDSRYANVKIAIMVVSCLFGCIAQFYPLPFPLNRLLLAVCVVAYFGLSAILQYFTSYTDRDLIWQSSPSSSGGLSVYVRGLLPKYGDTYTLVVESPWRREVARHSANVGTYFTSAGEFVEAALKRDIESKIRPAVLSAAAKKSE